MGLLGSNNPELTALWAMNPERAKNYVITVFEAVDGNVSKAAKKLNMGRTTIKRWIKANPELKAALERIRAAR